MLIWDKIDNISKGDRNVRVRIRHSNMLNLYESDDGSENNLLAKAINGEDGFKLVLSHMGWTFGFGQQDYNWHMMFFALDNHSGSSGSNGFNRYFSRTSYGDGDVGLIKDYGAASHNKPINYIGHSHSGNAGELGYDSEGIINNRLILEPEWETQDFQAIVDVPLPPPYWNNETGVNILNYRYYSEATGNQSGSSNIILGVLNEYGLSTYGEDLSWFYQTSDENDFRNVSYEDLPTTEILFGMRLAVINANGDRLFDIHADTEYNDLFGSGGWSSDECTIYQPYNIINSPPNYEFEIGLELMDSFNNIQENQTDTTQVKITSTKDYTGTVNLYALDSSDNINDVSSATGMILDEFDQAQYGTADIIQSIEITEGEEVIVDLQYTASEIIGYQTDTFSVIAQLSTIDSSYYYYSTEAQEQFNSLSNEARISYLDNIHVSVLDIDTYEAGSRLIEKPCDVIYHLLEQEMGYDKGINQEKLTIARALDSSVDGSLFHDYRLGFSVNEKISAKNLLNEIGKSSKLIPTLANDQLSFVYLRDTYKGGEQYYGEGNLITEKVALIKDEDIFQFKFTRTAIDDVITQIEVKYNYDYGMDKFLKTTGKLTVPQNYLYSGTQENQSYVNYYGFKVNGLDIDHTESFKEVENKYIRDDDGGKTARDLAKHILGWHQNQHNVIELTLPLKYFYLEIGDLIEFEKMILGKKLYGEKYVLDEPDYSDMPVRCGQFILPLFMITDITKTIKECKIKVIQLHHLSENTLNWKGIQLTMPNFIPYGVGDGDITGDSFTDILDVVVLINSVITGESLSEQEHQASDINQDGQINILDVVQLINQITGQ